MRLLKQILFITLFSCVFTKINPKALTESRGQEVIEIGSPLKELPPDLEEEPSADADDDDKSTTTTIQPATKKDTKKLNPAVETRRKGKGFDKNDGIPSEDEETRIEKELAEIYKDNADYKSDGSDEASTKAETTTSSRTTVTTTTTTTSSTTTVTKENVTDPTTEEDIPIDENKPIGRARDSFKFQPDSLNKADVERFRTSVDEISCDRGVTRKLDIAPDSAVVHTVHLLLIGIATILSINC